MSRESSQWEGMMGGCHIRCTAAICTYLHVHMLAQKVGCSRESTEEKSASEAPFAPGILKSLHV